MMKRILIAPIAALLLASCATQPTNFASMSVSELQAYNDGRPVLKQVHCTEERRTGSHIRKTWCRTVEDWVEHNNRALMALDTMNVRHYSAIRGGD